MQASFFPSSILLFVSWFVYTVIVPKLITTKSPRLCLAFSVQVQQTEQQVLLRGRRTCKQCVMLPHDIVSSVYQYPVNFHMLFLGVPDRLERYWSENLDLFESLQMSAGDAWLNMAKFDARHCSHQVVWFYPWLCQSQDPRMLIPLFHSEFMVMALMPSNISKSSRFCLFWRAVGLQKTRGY